MKIPLFIATFLLMATLMRAQTYTLVDGSVQIARTKGEVVWSYGTEIKDDVPVKGDVFHLSKSASFSVLNDASKLQLYFSCRMSLWLHKGSTLWVNDYEQYVDKDKDGNILPSDCSFIGTMRLEGAADFELFRIANTGVFYVDTKSAIINVRSVRFYVETQGDLTRVECYEGELILTNVMTLQDTIIKNGEAAQVAAPNGHRNGLIIITKLTNDERNTSMNRITIFRQFEWIYDSKP